MAETIKNKTTQILLNEDIMSLEDLKKYLSDKGVPTSALSRVDDSPTLNSLAKLASLGSIATGIAHEINTPLASVDMICSQLKEMLDTGYLDLKQFTAMVERLITSVRRIKNIAGGFKRMARDAQRDPFQNVKIKSLIDSVVELCEHRFRTENVKLIVDPFSETLEISCRPTEIEQVILNLCDNACDAIQAISDKWIRIQVRENKSKIEIRVIDCGLGISEEIEKKLFQPFFTTKEIGKGTGLGLSISRDLMEGHSGNLEIDHSVPNTCFKLTLPRTHASS